MYGPNVVADRVPAARDAWRRTLHKVAEPVT